MINAANDSLKYFSPRFTQVRPIVPCPNKKSEKSSLQLRTAGLTDWKLTFYAMGGANQVINPLPAILEKLIPVILLGGNDSEKTINLPDLVRLLRKCNRQLIIIVFSSGIALSLIRVISQGGIFSHALEPADPNDKAETLPMLP